MTYTCKYCGQIHLTERDMHDCPCRKRKSTCPRCNGTGVIAGGFLSPNIECPRCQGTGKV